jgi:uncharacterized OB-fold protein
MSESTSSPAWPQPMPDPVGLHAEWYAHCAAGELRFQRCSSCGEWRHPPRVLCAACGAGEWSWERSSGRGAVFSWTVTHQAIYPAFAAVAPYVIVVMELDEGVRIVTNLRDVDRETLALGLPLEIEIDHLSDTIGLPYARVAVAAS